MQIEYFTNNLQSAQKHRINLFHILSRLFTFAIKPIIDLRVNKSYIIQAIVLLRNLKKKNSYNVILRYNRMTIVKTENVVENLTRK